MGIQIIIIVIFISAVDEPNYNDLRPERFYDFVDIVRKKRKKDRYD